MMIFHVVSSEDWSKFEGKSIYEADSLQTEGFIHLSERHQVAGVLDRYYRNVPDLLLLHVDPARLTHEATYEAAPNGELFPHVYGPINKDAIVQIETIDQ
ncbi:DUF952 domain-containing protein [Spirosoma rigui]|uniref:DUF952 domain-containing protein n=1 Tax=Spirosoma rigui TaxID=564064 RepID=UPI0029373B5E|nr:DUF952 domain-containing protein [Spirosoma rigui]